MSDTQHHEGEHHPDMFKAYMVVFLVLCGFTAISFIVNAVLGIGSPTGMAIILGVAVCKATLVAMYFMHLKYDWFKVYFIVVPVAVLCVMMIIVLMPDGVVGWHLDEASSSSTANDRP